jgi:hypothetical protein
MAPLKSMVGPVAQCLALLLLALFARTADSVEYPEEAVKAAYLYRFAGFIEWPGASSPNPFVIDVIGAPGIARELRRILPGRPIHGVPASVREIAPDQPLGPAQIVYIAPGQAKLARALEVQKGHGPMLVVTDQQGGLDAGAALNFVTVDHTVRFEVSLQAAHRWGVKISSELLQVAIRVQSSDERSLNRCGVFDRLASPRPSCRRWAQLRVPARGGSCEVPAQLPC